MYRIEDECLHWIFSAYSQKILRNMLTSKYDGAVVLPDAVLLDVVRVLGGGHEPAHLHHGHVAPEVQAEHVVGAGPQVGDGVGVHLVTDIQLGEG